ncbi:hypothetical protein JZ751_009950 [Albula glossodonta]|uniref:Uncharacterized protein n=1 Tax=Albula glossodonta TaxID=121402 RepID=A0A8T2NWN9_9TELE|nr:hypothetical protein JZ751_009950 [Albula glossodonta]
MPQCCSGIVEKERERWRGKQRRERRGLVVLLFICFQLVSHTNKIEDPAMSSPFSGTDEYLPAVETQKGWRHLGGQIVTS